RPLGTPSCLSVMNPRRLNANRQPSWPTSSLTAGSEPFWQQTSANTASLGMEKHDREKSETSSVGSGKGSGINCRQLPFGCFAKMTPGTLARSAYQLATPARMPPRKVRHDRGSISPSCPLYEGPPIAHISLHAQSRLLSNVSASDRPR